MKNVLETVSRVAASDANVMVYGESGTGKELIARALHEQSNRGRNPFIQLSCAALPETLLESELFGYEKGAFTGAAGSKPGRFELADSGTLFLDEIGDISLTVQVKLLRVLEQMSFERLGGSKTLRVDIRLIGATNRDLSSMVKEGEFREDLFYRLNVIPITLPPLRNGVAISSCWLNTFSVAFPLTKELSAESQKLLDDYHWPGNVRELRNTIERSTILSRGKIIGPDDLPEEIRQGVSLSSNTIRLPAEGVALEKVERELITQALERTVGNRTKAAELLGISRHTLLYRIEKYGLDQ